MEMRGFEVQSRCIVEGYLWQPPYLHDIWDDAYLGGSGFSLTIDDQAVYVRQS